MVCHTSFGDIGRQWGRDPGSNTKGKRQNRYVFWKGKGRKYSERKTAGCKGHRKRRDGSSTVSAFYVSLFMYILFHLTFTAALSDLIIFLLYG